MEIAWTVSEADLRTYTYTLPSEVTVGGTVNSRICTGSAGSCPIRLTVFAHADVGSGTASNFDNFYEFVWTIDGAEISPLGCALWALLADGASQVCDFSLDYYPTKLKLKCKSTSDG
jgi:hypothetical protein